MTAEDREIARTAPAWWTGADVNQQTELPPLTESLARLDASIAWLIAGKPCKNGIGAADMIVIRNALAAERGRADAAERDARRYRWLRDPANSWHDAWNRLIDGDCAGHEFDGLVDAAINAATEGVQHGSQKA